MLKLKKEKCVRTAVLRPEGPKFEFRSSEVPSPERWRVGFAVLGEGQQLNSTQPEITDAGV